MFLELYKSAFFTLSIFTTSIYTAYNICKSKKVDFINPDYSIDKERLFSYLFTISKNIIPILTTSTLINYYSISVFDKTKHSFIRSIINVIFYQSYNHLYFLINQKTFEDIRRERDNM